jgi:4a-hydroxytetrahydrobiopterin dehydratase
MSDLAPPAGWSIVDGKLHREFTFKDFAEAFGFMTRVALAAEKLNHHPDWSNSWNTVTMDIVSHDKGAITEACVALAEKANAAAGGS